VDKYERLLSRELGASDSDKSDSETQKNQIDQTNSETRKSQMLRLVQAGLGKIEKEAGVKRDIQEKITIVSSVKGAIDAAVKSALEAAVAWAVVCSAT